MSAPLYFVHISDSHLGPTRQWTSPWTGKNPRDRLLSIAGAIAQLPTRPRFVVHTGDVVHDPDREAYALATEILSPLEIPLYFARGNHDGLELMREFLPAAVREDLLPVEEGWCYRFVYGDERFLVLDSQQSRPEIPNFGGLGQRQLEIVREEANRDGGWLSVFLHHAPADVDSRWWSERVGMCDGEALHEVLRPARERLRGVFAGHLHRSVQVYKEGITYIGAPSASTGFNLWPENGETDSDDDGPPAFNFVALWGDRMVVKTQAVI